MIVLILRLVSALLLIVFGCGVDHVSIFTLPISTLGFGIAFFVVSFLARGDK